MYVYKTAGEAEAGRAQPKQRREHNAKREMPKPAPNLPKPAPSLRGCGGGGEAVAEAATTERKQRERAQTRAGEEAEALYSTAKTKGFEGVRPPLCVNVVSNSIKSVPSLEKI